MRMLIKFSAWYPRVAGGFVLRVNTNNFYHTTASWNFPLKKPVIASSSNGSFLCWHPEQPFPYEHTKPMPSRQAELEEGESVLKVQYLLEEKNKYKPDGPTQSELEKIFHTEKYHFRLKPTKRYRKENPPKDREGL